MNRASLVGVVGAVAVIGVISSLIRGGADRTTSATPATVGVTVTPIDESRPSGGAAANAVVNAVDGERLRMGPQKLMEVVREAGIGRDAVVGAEHDPIGERDLIITVGPSWHRMPRHERLQAAQNLWKGWATIAAPRDPDAAHIKLVDTNGNSVGGSGVMGSSVSVVE